MSSNRAWGFYNFSFPIFWIYVYVLDRYCDKTNAKSSSVTHVINVMIEIGTDIENNMRGFFVSEFHVSSQRNSINRISGKNVDIQFNIKH